MKRVEHVDPMTGLSTHGRIILKPILPTHFVSGAQISTGPTLLSAIREVPDLNRALNRRTRGSSALSENVVKHPKKVTPIAFHILPNSSPSWS
jgi:hypothetical protein